MLKKLSVLVLAVAMVGLYTPTSAQSFDFEALADQGFSAEDIALLMSLFGGTTTTTSSNRGCDVDYLRDLSMGSTGADVQKLQMFLNDAGFTVSASGAGSVGMESMYYGSLTANAVSRFQMAYSADILAPLGLTAGTGYFGASSRAKVRDLCADMPADQDGDTDDDSDDDDSDSEGLSGGEASLERYEMNDADASEVEEGESAEVAEIEFEVRDGDVRIDRLDLTFEDGAGNDEDDPWDTFETVRLLVDGDEIAEEDVDRRGDWLRDRSPYVFRFSGLDYVVREDDMAMITVEVTTRNSVRGADDGEEWTVYVDDRGIRGVDSEGIQSYTGNDAEQVTFDVVEAGEGEELNVRASDDDPDASTIAVDDNSRSPWYSVFIFDLEAEDGDIDLETVGGITVTTGTKNYEDVVNNARLVIDGETFTRVDVEDEDTTSADLSFDIDGDYTVEADETVQVEVQLRFNAQDGNYAEGETVQVSVTGNEITGEGANDVTASGNVDGETHTLRVSGLFASNFDSSNTRTTNQNGQTVSVTYEIEFDVTAFEDDFFVPVTTNRGTSATAGVTYQVETSNNTVVDADDADTSAALTSTANRVTAGGNDYFRIREGRTETFTLNVTVTNDDNDDALVPGFIRVQLLELNYRDTADTADTQYDFLPAVDYETSLVNVQA